VDSLDFFHNPKRIPSSPTSKSSKSSWYDYYAGYSPEFVQDVLKYLNLTKDAVVLDPWNGSGTTTQVAEDYGCIAIGYDINPVMVIVAKARRLDPGVFTSLYSLCKDLLKKASTYQSTLHLNDEPLETWLTQESAMFFRNIERAIQQLLVGGQEYHLLYCELSFDFISTLAAFFYTALFRTLRKSLTSFWSTNPTWIVTPQKEQRLDLPVTKIHDLFEREVNDMSQVLNGLSSKETRLLKNRGRSRLDLASSIDLPLEANSVDAVISSPPYCTRIDYAIATKPELAILGCGIKDDLRDLRERMIGSPIIAKQTPDLQDDWGESCLTFLEAVSKHPSKASSTYYLKNLLQYFDLIFRSFNEINRTLSNGKHCVLVAQSSYYKDILIDLPAIFIEMGDSIGWKLSHREDFAVKHSMVDANHRAKKYRNSAKVAESVLMFSKKT
jgi:SAM-dependent methyltransferase